MRQVPRVVGETDRGDPIYEIQGVRLVLRPSATHFNRLLACQKCGRDSPGRGVLNLRDLESTAQAIICSRCVASPRMPGPGTSPSAPPSGPPATVGLIPAGVEEEARRAADSAEAWVQKQSSNVADEISDTYPADIEALAALDAAVSEAIERLNERVDALSAELLAARATEAMPLGAVVDRIALSQDELRVAHAEMSRQLDELSQHLAQGPATGDGPQEAPVADDLGAALMERVDEISGRLDALTQRFGENPETTSTRLRAIEARLHHLEATPAPREDEGQLRRLEEITARLGRLEKQFVGRADTEGQRLATLERRIEETVEHLSGRADVQAELRAALETPVEQIGVALDRAGQASAEAARVAAENEDLRRRSDQMGARLDELRASIEEGWARTKSESATFGQANQELAGTLARLTERVESLAEQVAGAGDQERLEALDRRVEEALARLNEIVEAQRQQLEAVAAASPSAEDIVGRIGALEQQARHSLDEVSELNELHAALDAGLGNLRAELGDVRTAVSRVAEGQGDVDDRLEAYMRVQQVPGGEQGKGRRAAKKAAETALSAVSGALEDVLGEQRQLRDQVDAVQRASDAATASAARAASQALSLGSIRSDMKLLHQEVAEQNDVIEGLLRSIEGLRRPPPAPEARAPGTPTTKPATPVSKARATKQAAPAPPQRAAAKRELAVKTSATRAPAPKAARATARPTKAPATQPVPPAVRDRATKAVRPVAKTALAPVAKVPARAATARAAIARAAAAQTAAKAPAAAKRAPRAKKPQG